MPIGLDKSRPTLQIVPPSWPDNDSSCRPDLSGRIFIHGCQSLPCFRVCCRREKTGFGIAANRASSGTRSTTRRCHSPPSFEETASTISNNERSSKEQQPPDAYRTVAVERRAEGVHLYTYVEGGRLLRYCWLIERQTRGEDGGWSKHAFLLPTRPSYLITLRILSREAADCTFKPYAGSYTTHGEVAGARQAYVTFGSNGPSRHVIEKVGFQQ